MLKKIFYLLLIIGMFVIFFLVYNNLTNPWEEIPSLIVYGISNPLWLRVFVIVYFCYIVFLSLIFNKLKKIFDN